jgi:hypothetical protein
MYSNKLVCSVKVGKKILREKNQNNESTVFIPFGSEYSLVLKNLGGQNAVVNIEIDGRKVSENGFYMRAGQTADIERFVESLTEGRRFKFIEKTQEISDFRGDKIDDGLIRVTWQFEKPLPEVKEIKHVHTHDHYNSWHHGYGCRCPFCTGSIWYGPVTFTNTGILRNGQITCSSSNLVSKGSSMSGGTQSACFSSQAEAGLMTAAGEARSFNDAGITVEGSKSHQTFGTAYASELETNVHSMIIILKGYIDNHKTVSQPIFIREKIQCPSCGRKWKMNIEFCGKCGTALKD